VCGGDPAAVAGTDTPDRPAPTRYPDTERAQLRARAHAERRLVAMFPEEYTEMHRVQALRLGIEPRGPRLER
jgi:hypothetical protein